MNVGQVVAQVMKREGVEYLPAYPLNPLTERAAVRNRISSMSILFN